MLGRARLQGRASASRSSCADDLLAISNGAEVGARAAGDGGKVAVRFADTMPMSTYLVAFVVGPLEVTEPVDVDGMPLRVVYLPGKEHLAGFALEVGAFALRCFADYYGIPYPGDKVDLVALPDFAVRRHGEPRLHHLPRDAAARRPGDGHPGRAAARSPTSSPTSSPTCGSATS